MKTNDLGWLYFATVLGACGQLSNSCGYEVPDKVRDNPSAMFRGSVGTPNPVVDLPEFVEDNEGQVTLWADFAKADEKGVPLYLVNQTNEDCSFASQDHDIYMKLEFKNDAGKWQRAQAHLSSWCGNSYYNVALPARHFFEFRGYYPTEGQRVTVRYASRNGDIQSNLGEAMVSDADLEAVALDSTTAALIPRGIMQAIDCRPEQPLPDSPSLVLRKEAVGMLRWLPRNETAILMVEELRRKLDEVAPGKDKEALLHAIDQFLAEIDLERPDDVTLMRKCIDRIAEKASADPKISESMAWSLLTANGPNGPSLSPTAELLEPGSWKDLIDPAVAILSRDKAMTTESAGPWAVLRSRWIIDALVEDADLEVWLLSSSPRLQDIGASALARRSRFARLTVLAWNLPAAQQVSVLKALAYSGPERDASGIRVRQPDFGTSEPDFWKHCATTMPVETANALWQHSFRSGYNPFNRLIHDPLHDYFKAEAERGKTAHDVGKDHYPLQTALEMFASWGLEEDDPVWRGLLEHGGYHLQEGWNTDSQKPSFTKVYFVREAAKRALIKRGQMVPEDLLTREPSKDDAGQK